ncbi:MAG: flagellar hook-associated protein FlgL [Desulfitobacteriaceae bacterium]
MRITNLMLGQNLLRNLDNAQNNMDKYQNELSSGHKIFQPSDDPVGIESALRIKSTLSAVKQWGSNADQGLSFLQTTDSALNNIMGMLQRARELAVQGASDTVTGDGRKDIAAEVTQLAAQVGVVANTKYGSKYLFGGTNTNIPWVSGTWNGNSQAINYEIGSQSYVQINSDGTPLFNAATGIGKTLTDFETHLTNNQGDLVAQDISTLDTQLSAVMAARADVGARSNRLETIQQQLDSMSTDLTQNLSKIQDVDVAKVVVDLNNQENVYRAALSVGAKIIQPSLVDFLR